MPTKSLDSMVMMSTIIIEIFNARQARPVEGSGKLETISSGRERPRKHFASIRREDQSGETRSRSQGKADQQDRQWRSVRGERKKCRHEIA